MAAWDWRAWSLAVPLVAVTGWFAFRWVSALAFRHVLLGGLARRHGWHVDLPAVNGRTAFDEQERRRRGEAWALLRRGRISEGYRTGVFGRTHTGAWHPELTVTGVWCGRRFTASQIRRYEVTSGETTRRKVRRRASLTLAGSFPAAEVRTRWPARFRGYRADGGGISMELGPRLRRGRLLAALAYLSDAADGLSRTP
ncbi:hypothetical protein [Actinophytocola sp.]|uniref:hypothetical protein n=1 Tax=Actinophytocola sp. TaxID=1872138 RepID=UPI00389AC551